MKIATIHSQGRDVLAVDAGDGFRECAVSVEHLLAGLEPVLGAAVEGDFKAPIYPHNVIGVGLNFHDTVREMGWNPPEEPYLFPKFPSSVTGPEGAVIYDVDLIQRLDWEGEVGVVIGRKTSRVHEKDALESVFGYVAANDISARDLQAADGQWVRGKAMDTFCPLGPWILTADEVPDPQNIAIRTWVDGELVQDGSTSDMIFNVATLISYISRYITLHPGDIILTGTPSGCGDFQDPPRHLKPGSVVEIEATGLGRLSNPVQARE